MIVLTLPGLDHVRAGRSAADLASVYRDVLQRKEAFWKRLRRLHARNGWDWIGSSYVTVLEQHQSGVPHVNLLVHSPHWSRALRRERPKNWLFDGDLALIAEAAGWGWRCTAEPVRDGNVSKLAGYIVKLAGRTDAMHGELAKACQIPTRAPRHFRRLRAGKGFLVKRRRKEGWTGAIVRRKWTEHGDELVIPLVLSRNEEYMQRVRECCAREAELALADEEKRSLVVKRRKELHSQRRPMSLALWLAKLAEANDLEAEHEPTSHTFVARARPPPPAPTAPIQHVDPSRPLQVCAQLPIRHFGW